MRNIALGVILVLILGCSSLFVGVSDVSLPKLVSGNRDAWDLFWYTRLPRTLALILAGASMSICGTIMQLLSRNRFVEPSTAGTVASASLGYLMVLLLAPALPEYAKMLVTAGFALLGTVLFMQILQAIPLRSALVVPLVGIMLGGGDAMGGIIGAITTFFAYRYDMIQSVMLWTAGDFSTIMQGRYELLWLALPLTVLAYLVADRFTVAGLGAEFSAGLGLNYRRTMFYGMVIVACVTALIVVTGGQIPFLGLVVPNIIALMMGDNMRRNLPFVALLGSAIVLLCDIVGRLIRYPFEIPIGTMMGVIGSAIFLILLFKGRARLA